MTMRVPATGPPQSARGGPRAPRRPLAVGDRALAMAYGRRDCRGSRRRGCGSRLAEPGPYEKLIVRGPSTLVDLRRLGLAGKPGCLEPARTLDGINAWVVAVDEASSSASRASGPRRVGRLPPRARRSSEIATKLRSAVPSVRRRQLGLHDPASRRPAAARADAGALPGRHRRAGRARSRDRAGAGRRLPDGHRAARPRRDPGLHAARRAGRGRIRLGRDRRARRSLRAPAGRHAGRPAADARRPRRLGRGRERSR